MHRVLAHAWQRIERNGGKGLGAESEEGLGKCKELIIQGVWKLVTQLWLRIIKLMVLRAEPHFRQQVTLNSLTTLSMSKPTLLEPLHCSVKRLTTKNQ